MQIQRDNNLTMRSRVVLCNFFYIAVTLTKLQLILHSAQRIGAKKLLSTQRVKVSTIVSTLKDSLK